MGRDIPNRKVPVATLTAPEQMPPNPGSGVCGVARTCRSGRRRGYACVAFSEPLSQYWLRRYAP